MPLDALKEQLGALSLEELQEIHDFVGDKIRQQADGKQGEAVADSFAVNDEGSPVRERRQHPRFDTHFPCQIMRQRDRRADGSEDLEEGTVLDISRGGVGVLAAHEIKKGEALTIYLCPNPATTKRVHGIVVRSHPADNGWDTGVRYVDQEEFARITKSAG